MAAYPLAKMRFRGRSTIFYALLATLIVPAQLTYIPSFVLAVNVFHYYDTLPALILPNLVSAFNIFLLRQAFRGVPNDLIDAARVDGAGEWRIWWSILLPIVRPSLAAVAIFTFVTSWNDFLWPSLMLHTKEGLTLPVGPRRAAELLPVRLPRDRRRRDDHRRPDPAVLHRRPALLRARPGGRGQGVTAGRSRRDATFGPGDARVRGRPAARLGGRAPAAAPVAGMTVFRHLNVRSPGGFRELAEAFQAARSPGPGPAAAGRGGPGGRPAPGARRRPDASSPATWRSARPTTRTSRNASARRSGSRRGRWA